MVTVYLQSSNLLTIDQEQVRNMSAGQRPTC